MGLTKAQIEAAPSAKPKKLSAPELGGDGHVFVRRMSIGAREDWECWQLEAQENGLSGAIKKFGGFRTFLLVRSLCDENGVLIFDDPVEGVRILRLKDDAVIDRLYDEAIDFCGLTPQAQKELEGNSPAAPSEDSP